MTTAASTNQGHRRRGGVCELFVDANLLSFRVRQEYQYAVIYHSPGRDRIDGLYISGTSFDAREQRSAARTQPGKVLGCRYGARVGGGNPPSR